MSLFICAHGNLICSCPYCNTFSDEDFKNESEEQEDENEVLLSTIVRSMKREKIEY